MSSMIDSISGTRGIVGDNWDPRIGVEIAMAFGMFLKTGPVIVGGDTRTSHDMLKSAVISGLLAVGVDVIDIGRVTTPTVQQMIRKFSATGGMVITASHNPIIWNGIKLMNASGSFLDESEFLVYQGIRSKGDFVLQDWQSVGKLTVYPDALSDHVDRVLSVIDTTSIRQANLKVLIDPNNGAGCVANPILFEKLGVKYEMINGEPTGIFSHNPEPLKTNLDGIISTLSRGGFDIGFVQDADADRLVILDETGHFIGEDYSLAFCVDQILSDCLDSEKRVVVNLSTSNVVEWVAKKHGAKVTYTRIGETHVTHEIKAQKAQVGGEGNGGVIYPAVGWGRDSLVGMVVALRHLAEKKKTVSQIVSEYPTFVMLREKVSLNSREDVVPFLTKVREVFSEAEFNEEDGVKAVLADGWVHVRPSNTEPIARIFIEAPSFERAQEYFSRLD
jgi:phosphomannomutase